MRMESQKSAILPRLEARRATLMKIPHVLAVGVGGVPSDEHVVVIVEAGARQAERRIRDVLAGLPVEIQESEPFRAQ
jgi:hypothetical protein